ncbi:uncharacterized protein METZ01_LOCUS302088 [marine metagenome]|uniref:Uncharacterized protein n=1 Tax=marine metagenome TaxID=408172 RepID=A0A382MJS9_9ZZZZ
MLELKNLSKEKEGLRFLQNLKKLYFLTNFSFQHIF